MLKHCSDSIIITGEAAKTEKLVRTGGRNYAEMSLKKACSTEYVTLDWEEGSLLSKTKA